MKDNDPLLTQFDSALAAGDVARLGACLDAGLLLTEEGWTRAADRCVQERHWDCAALLLVRVAPRAPALEFQLNLSRNLAAIRMHRPELYETLMAPSGEGNSLSIGPASDGSPTVFETDAAGRTAGLGPGSEPARAAATVIARIGRQLDAAASLALCGVGDGRLLRAIADHRANTLLGMESPVYIAEPRPAVVMHALMLHDFTAGPGGEAEGGPIVQRRFRWLVGPRWAEAFRRELNEDPGLLPPDLVLTQEPGGEAIHARLGAVVEAAKAATRRRVEQAEAYYNTLDPAALAAVFGDRPPRRPRAMLMATRFSTVLQYSTRDTAAALERLGWSVQVLTEATPCHRITARQIAATLDEFRPDMVIQIDHLRVEHDAILPGLFPARLPFVCWVQDDLANLTNPRAGASVRLRDFVLTCAAASYAQHFGYPPRQCIYVEKLTRVPPRPARWTSDGEDIVYVSNASKTPDAVVAKELGDAAAAAPPVRAMVEAICVEIRRVYERGGCLQALSQVRQIVRAASARAGVRYAAADEQRLVLHHFNTLNNILYRQQALGWAVEVAESMGLSVGLYGAGWADHPRFCRLARGPVRYGPDLEALTRRARINLQIVPYCSTHQRLLDGVAAGGFFLVRLHPLDTLARDIGGLIARHAPPQAQTLAHLRAALDPTTLARLDALVQLRNDLDEHGDTDPVAIYRRHMSEGLGHIYASLPGLEDVAFTDRPSLEAAVRRFIHDPAARAHLWRQQHDFINAHFTYEAGMRRITRRIGELIAGEPTAALAAPGAPGATGAQGLAKAEGAAA